MVEWHKRTRQASASPWSGRLIFGALTTLAMTGYSIPLPQKAVTHKKAKFAIPTGNGDCVPLQVEQSKKGCYVEPVKRIGYSISEAALSLGLSVPMVVSLIKEQKLRTVKVGTRVIVSVQSLHEFMEGKENCPTTLDGKSDESQGEED